MQKTHSGTPEWVIFLFYFKLNNTCVDLLKIQTFRKKP